ncbi:hypothetical protein E6Q11_00905 [Candidatus Dojkabacteria bacterium]|uniref:Uncharacterized protein n=1 Tax=Candidatus Dojkabacteria bacterium TaxID=2099670 RepID=A0A5C7JAD9_9BACT|nr:MAG: hypothetical protein E6Q11_00905 [Candidatus Dojkabacteria bacterium]
MDSNRLNCNPCDGFDTPCNNWSIVNDVKINCLADVYAQEQLNIGGANINIFPLRGVKGSRILTPTVLVYGGDGDPQTGWFTSAVSDDAYIVSNSYVVLDFGVHVSSTGRSLSSNNDRAFTINSIKFKQSAKLKQVLTMRVERSVDGINWVGVDVINCDVVTNATVKWAAPARYWRLRPTSLSQSCKWWGMSELAVEFNLEKQDAIQDPVFLENRNRQYVTTPTNIKAIYDVPGRTIDISKFGYELNTDYVFNVNFSQVVAALGRPMLVGDIIEIPSERFYNARMEEVPLLIEVTSVAWDTQSYTPGWRPIGLSVVGKQALSSVETKDVFNAFDKSTRSSVMDLTNTATPIQQHDQVTPDIHQEGLKQVPQKGTSVFDTHAWNGGDKTVVGAAGSGTQDYNTQETIPPDGREYTRGQRFPDSPSDGDWHVMEYTGTAYGIPDRLYRYSSAKQRWLYFSKDVRGTIDTASDSLTKRIDGSEQR